MKYKDPKTINDEPHRDSADIVNDLIGLAYELAEPFREQDDNDFFDQIVRRTSVDLDPLKSDRELLDINLYFAHGDNYRSYTINIGDIWKEYADECGIGQKDLTVSPRSYDIALSFAEGLEKLAIDIKEQLNKTTIGFD